MERDYGYLTQVRKVPGASWIKTERVLKVKYQKNEGTEEEAS